ncbi:hypothetical protein B566_EDAN014910, partial [Ephemera danica]
SPSYQQAPKQENNHNGERNHQQQQQQKGGGSPAAPASGDRKLKDGTAFKVLKDVGPSSISDSMSLSSPPGTTVASPRELSGPGEPPLPGTLQTLPELLRHLLAGRALTSRPANKSRKIALYVCAADSQDCCVEKGVLHTSVYPALRAHCRSRGYELHIVDLHWKTALEKQQDHEFPELCLGELARQSEVAYIIPILFLSNSLGTPLLPKTIENQDFEMALSSASTPENKGLLQKWYKLDSHAQPPCYRLQPIASHIPGFKEDSPEEKERALGEWRSEIDRTLAVMVDEVHNTVLMSQELARRCIWLCRVFTHIQSPVDAVTSAPGQAELRRRLDILQNNLKNQLAERHVLRMPVRWRDGGLDPNAQPEHQAYVDEVAQRLSAHLKATIHDIMEEDETKSMLKASHGVEGELFQELMQQTAFCQRAAQCSVNREGVLQDIKNYLSGTGGAEPLVLYGPRGCGKSTLVARAAQCVHTWRSEALLVVRFVGLSPASGTTEQLLRSISAQCSLLAHGETCRCPHNVTSYREIIPQLMAATCLRAPLIILIDGIDQVREFGSMSCDWLPLSLPENIKLVISVEEDSAMLTEIKAKIKDSTKLIKVPPLGKKEAQSILMSSVVQYNHSVNSRIQDCVKSSVQECTLPLYVKILAWQTSWWADREHNILPKGNIQEQLHILLEELENILGKIRVKNALALVGGGFCVRRWRDSSLQAAISQRYMGEESQREASHILRSYFQGNWAAENSAGMAGRLILQPNKTDSCYNRRKLDELPYQIHKSSDDITEKYLFNHEWLYDKVSGSGIYQLLEDFALKSGDEVALMQKCLEKCSPALSYDGRQFYSQMFLALNAVSETLTPRLKSLHQVCTTPPVPTLLPLDTKCEATVLPEEVVINTITHLPDMPHFVTTLATERGEISVWDVRKGEMCRTIKQVPYPASLKPVDWRHCVVLCKRELRVFDLDNGELVTRLKGVMNQKMPYYGLHDSRHLVALSRNRMYVNLMDLVTGDCVTTFKAGEDRFLDSLLVSRDGRTLVCGDETQKPFPLLVWDLTSRKLMYDLRIPHHDFITNLAAITDEGHYVCSVCKEVDEPSPNFIIVYDLQSGTLFKKWKPGVDTVSIAISSIDTCVVSGLQDARILVWDLTTGNCRFTLSGHTAPVTLLRLDPAGSCFLSADSTCRDRSLRLWSLETGSLVSVFTPDHAFTACEVASGGRAVVLALRGHTGIFVLHLHGGGEEDKSGTEIFGNAELHGKVVELSEEDSR